MPNLALITDENDTEVQLRSTVTELCEAADSVAIFTRPDLSHATDLVKAIKDRARDIEDERKRLVKPFNDGVDAINGRFKAMRAPLLEAESVLKAKMLTFQQKEALEAEEERKRLEAEQRQREEEARKKQEEENARAVDESGDELDRAPMPVAEVIAAAVVSSFKPTTYGQTGATSTVKKVWTGELVDIGQVPKEYLLLDQVKVNQAIRAGAREIPGLRIFEKETIAIR